MFSALKYFPYSDPSMLKSGFLLIRPVAEALIPQFALRSQKWKFVAEEHQFLKLYNIYSLNKRCEFIVVVVVLMFFLML